MDTEARELELLLMIVGAVDGMPLQMSVVVDAYKLGAITATEARSLQRFSRLSPRGRKAAALQPRDVTDAQNQATGEKLEALRAEVESLLATRRDGRRG